MQSQMIAIKPHHFVDIVTSLGDGQTTFEPHPYGHAVHTVSRHILNNPDVVLQVELGADDICRPCMHNIDGTCDDMIDTSFRPGAPASKGAWNLMIDMRWCDHICVKHGDRFTAAELAQRIQDRMGNITDIYREIPADMTADRARRLLKGIEFLCRHEP